MKQLRKLFPLFLMFTISVSSAVLLHSCSKGGESAETPKDNEDPDEDEDLTGLTYTNPVYNAVFADPTVIKGQDGYFYAYATGDVVPMAKSKNLVDWASAGNAFTSRPSWKAEGSVWAPDINYFNNKYYMYYSMSTWGDANPGIGVATADSPTGPFTNSKKLFDTDEIGVTNSIDPVYYEDNGVKYLVWGSLSNTANQGIFGVQLSGDGLSYIPNTKFKIGAGDMEGSMIYKRGNYYYYLGSKGSCCEGAGSTYHVIVARSTTFKGPYLDKNGKDIAERGNGSTILDIGSAFVGPGHTSQIIKDDEGTEWILYHALPLNAATAANSFNRLLLLDKITWVNDWPIIANGRPTSTKQKGPVFKN